MIANHRFFKPLTFLVATAAFSVFSQGNPGPLGQFESDGDIGSPKLAGSAQYDDASRQYTLSGAGSNMWLTTDQCHFLSRRIKGDFILRARLEFVSQGGNAHRKAGWMVRPSLDPGAPYADAAEHGNGLTQIQFRRAAGNKTEKIDLAITNANLLEFKRQGSNYTFSAARDGEPFVSATLTNLDLGDDIQAGLFICSHDADVVEKALFRDVRITRQKTNMK